MFGMAVVAATALGGVGEADAQANNAVVRVEVRYPNGQLVNDTNVCSYVIPTLLNAPEIPSSYTNATFFQAGHRLKEPSGPISEIAVPGGQQYVAYAYNCPSVRGEFVATYNFGPAGPWDVGSNHRALNSFMLDPGELHTVVLTVGEGVISGRFDGLHSCSISAIGVPDFGDQRERQFGRSGAASGTSTTYTSAVPPGRYRVQAVCSGVVMHYPPGSTQDNARYFRVGHGQTISGVDFPQITQPAIASGGSFQVAEGSQFLSFCADTYLPDGSLYFSNWVRETFNRDREEHLAWASGPEGIYQLRISDCMGLGFDHFWYPNARSIEDAEWLVPGEELTEIVDILGSGAPRCNGKIPTILGDYGPNLVIGTEEADVIVAGGGADEILGLSGNDTICAGDGDDRVFGNAGADWIDAGAGNDWIGAGWGEDTVYGGAGHDFIRGFKHNDTIFGGTGNDRITGGWGNDVLRGGAGNDVLRAYYGADKLFGDAGNDVLVAGNGPDFLVGGPGPSDRLFGDQGRDICNDVGVTSEFTECEFINGN